MTAAFGVGPSWFFRGVSCLHLSSRRWKRLAAPMDLSISRPERIRPISPITAVGGVLRVHARSQIARRRAAFSRFSEMR